MTGGLLLDTHTQLWLEHGQMLRLDTFDQISDAGPAGRLFVSDISCWELGVASSKKNARNRPDLNGLSPGLWLAGFCERFHAQRLAISSEIAAEAGLGPGSYGHGDPGDCFLIATARVHNLTLVTRDARILEISGKMPEYLSVLVC